MLVGLAANHGEEKTVMIDATYLKAHRTASSPAVKKGSAHASLVENNAKTGETRQALLQTPQSERDHVRQAQRLETCDDPLRQMSEGLPVCNRPQSSRLLLAMCPDPRIAWGRVFLGNIVAGIVIMAGHIRFLNQMDC